MEFIFRGKYALRFDETEVDYLKGKVESILVLSITPRSEITADHISGDRDITEEWREDMFLDSWILNIYPIAGQTMLFVKCAGEDNVTVRAINIDTEQYEMFDMDVVEAVDILQELCDFIRQSNSQNSAIENGFCTS